MRMEDVDARRAYIESARRSFDARNGSYEFEKEPEHKKGEASDELSFFKIRFVIAALLFAAYIFCEKTDASVYDMTAKKISEKIEKTFDYRTAGDRAWQAFFGMMQK